ncbi:hypothetical protein FN846DRAFT_974004 [Sphaerosporella brunnea]|uniref:Secreted protein n=1 Tax=Sphaerosporella brunnea TaxID=1250544 RepID=A0A5J5EHP1_9PEZI|nr:hypothetical protein FN846DRAFT_974004 [Sphaerosporella brunnea]
MMMVVVVVVVKLAVAPGDGDVCGRGGVLTTVGAGTCRTLVNLQAMPAGENAFIGLSIATRTKKRRSVAAR